MTTTPESWDDVGCLSLKVDCISEQVEDVQRGLAACQAAFNGFHHSQLKKLRDEIALIYEQDQEKRNKEQRKERCHAKVCSIVAILLFLCILSLQILQLYAGMAPGFLQKPSNAMRNPSLDDLESSGATTLVPAAQLYRERQRNIRNGQQPKQDQTIDAVAKQKLELFVEKQHLEKEIGDGRKHLEDHIVKPSDSKKVEEEKDSEPKQTPELEVQSAQHPQPSDAEGRAQGVSKNLQEVTKDVGADVAYAQDKESNEKEDPEDDEQPREESGDNKGLALSIGVGTAVPGENAEGQRQDPIKAVFWVCFPPLMFEESVRNYGHIFNEVASRKKWNVYPFCYLDTRRLNPEYDEHFCHDPTKISFVIEMEKRSDVVSDNELASIPRSEIPLQHIFQDCLDVGTQNPEWFDIKSPVWFTRTFQKDQHIEASLVEKFVDDVYSNKLPERVPTKRDL